MSVYLVAHLSLPEGGTVAKEVGAWATIKVLQGLAKEGQRQDNRLPITFDRLKQLIDILPSICMNQFEVNLFAAAFTLAFFAFLRVNEILAPQLSVRILGSKTDQLGVGSVIHLKTVGSHRQVCPLRCMRAYLSARPAGAGLLFKHFSGAPLTRYQFQAVLKKCAASLGWQVSRFSSHSFRIGASTTAVINGMTMEELKTLGRWKSQAVRVYIRE
ncbi:uncharacterized protein [Littorina saxatilis]|uniref:uncharacterized protein n=1 Tax=Littorina saxatilis TaxID=31220 RepID=UPI0038B62D67